MTDHDRFICGQGESGRMYLTHTRFPRFVGELLTDDDLSGVLDGLSLSLHSSGEVLGNIVWHDEVPGEPGLLSLIADIEAFLDEMDFRGDAEVDATIRKHGGIP